MSRQQPHMNLALYNASSGISVGAWRRSDSSTDGVMTREHIAAIAQQCERAKMDAFFLADNVSPAPVHYRQAPNYPLEPMTVLGALSMTTSKIGLIATGSTSYLQPYNLARMMATIDHLSRGRAGWNIVTSYAGAQNYSTTPTDHDERYRKADEYLQVVTRLWDSWRDDAIVQDTESGVWADPSRVRRIDFEGEYYRVAGPLNVPRSPQGWPVFAQAGSSAAGVAFSAAWADLVFTPQTTLESAQAFYADVKKRAAEFGRDPSAIRVLPAFVPIIADTETEAKKISAELLDLIDYEAGRAELARFIAPAKIDDLELDEPIPQERLVHPDRVEAAQTRYRQSYELAMSGATLREMIRVRATATDHASVVGTAEQAADVMESFFTQGGADGFMFMASYMPGALDAITDQLIPVLRERGLFRSEYSGNTLRDHLGLSRPAGRDG